MNVMSRKQLLIAVVFFVLALSFRLVNLANVQSPAGDEGMHRLNAVTYALHGHLGPDNWYHPPLKHLLTFASMKTFGDNPYGWRMRNVLAGAVTVAAVFWLGTLLFGGGIAASLAAILILFDPLHITFSRSSFEDIPALLCLVCAVGGVLAFLRTESRWSLFFTGLMLGFAIALRTYSLAITAFMTLFLVWQTPPAKRTVVLLDSFSFLVIVPFLVYLLQFIPWFARGYTLDEWQTMQRFAFADMFGVTAGGFNERLQNLGGPSMWFVKQMGIGFATSVQGPWQRFHVIINNIPVWLWALPALAYLLYSAMRERLLLVIPCCFGVLYVPFLLTSRPIFLYSSLSLLPFIFLAIGYAVGKMPPRWRHGVLLAAVTWGMYLYPLVAGFSVPAHLYQPLLKQITMFRPSL